MKLRAFLRNSAVEVLGLMLLTMAALMAPLPSFLLLGEPEPPKSLLK